MSNQVLVILQQRDGQLHRSSWETLAAGQALASALGGAVDAVLLGSGVGELAREVSGRAALAALHVADAQPLAEFTPGAYQGVLERLLGESGARWILLPHTYQSMDFYPRLAASLEASVLPGATGFRSEGGDVIWNRSVLGGKLVSEVRVKGDKPVLVSLQAGSFSADQVVAGNAPLREVTVDAGSLAPGREILGIEHAAEEEVDLTKADIIVAAGRGVGGEDKMGPIEELAAALGAEVGASRPVIDNGWLPRDRQIGSSGQTVAPKLYLAIGISGAIQHLVGMKGSGCVVAINKDPGAPIFSVADYGVVGDLHEVVPALTAAVQEVKSS